MATAYTSLLGLALPVTGELQGTWGTTVNDSITSLLDTAVAGTTTLSADTDVTLSTTTGAANQARQAILLCSGARTVLRTITAPAQSKIYTVINATTGGFSVKLVGVGPTTGVTIVAGESALVAWNGSDFIKISNTGGAASFTNVTVSGTTTLSGLTASTALALNGSKEVVSVTNTGTGNNVLATSPTLTTPILGAATATSINKVALTAPATAATLTIADGKTLTANNSLTLAGTDATTMTFPTTSASIARTDAGQTFTGTQTFSSNPVLSGGTANGVLYLDGSKVATSGSALTFDGTNLATTGTSSATKFIPTGGTATGNGMYLSAANTLGWSTNGTKQLELDSSGNLGLGVTPSAWSGLTALQVSGTAALYANNSVTGLSFNQYFNGTNNIYLRNDFSNRLQMDSGAFKFFTAPSGTAGNAITFTQAMTLDASGNLGLGVTPSAWVSGSKALQITPFVSVSAQSNGAANFGFNFYEGGTNTFNYATTDEACRFSALTTGGFGWFTAPSGTAGNTISFTQAMTLDASGNLLLGTNSTDSTNKLQVAGRIGATGFANTNGQYAAISASILQGYPTFGFAQYLLVENAASNSYGMSWHTTLSGTQAEKMRLDASGNLGIGTSSPGAKLDVYGGAAGTVTNVQVGNASTAFQVGVDSSNNAQLRTAQNVNMLFYTNATERARITSGGDLQAYGEVALWPSASGGAGSYSIKRAATNALTFNYDFSGAELARFTSGGQLGLGFGAAFSALANLDILTGGQGGGIQLIRNASSTPTSGQSLGTYAWKGVDSANSNAAAEAMIEAVAAENFSGSTAATNLLFYTKPSGTGPGSSPTERARITSGGILLVGTTSAPSIAGVSTDHAFVAGTGGRWVSGFRNTTTGTPWGLAVEYSGAAPNDTSSNFLYCYDSAPALRMSVRSNGGIANYQSNNVDLSDSRTKKDIAPAASMWSKIGALEIVTYKYNDQTHDDVNVGVIAQQVEQVEPVWVDSDGFGETPEDGVPLKTVYTKDITFAAIKALQEAMTRIEQLEARVAALEAA